MASDQLQHTAGICWISEPQWTRFLEVAEDASLLEDSWQEWADKTDDMITAFAEKGITVIKVPVDVEELIQWCAEKERVITSSSRAEFVTQLMTKAHNGVKH